MIKKTIKRMFIIVSIIVVITVLFVTGVIIADAIIHKDEVPSFFGWKPFIVLSGSMEDDISTGDLAIVKEVDILILKENDIISFINDTGTVTTHRIVEIVEENGVKKFRTKGDSNNAVDPDLVLPECVEGLFIFRIPMFGNILINLKEPKTVAIILLAILVIGLLWMNMLEKKENKKAMAENEQYKKEFEEFKKRQEAKK